MIDEIDNEKNERRKSKLLFKLSKSPREKKPKKNVQPIVIGSGVLIHIRFVQLRL